MKLRHCGHLVLVSRDLPDPGPPLDWSLASLLLPWPPSGLLPLRSPPGSVSLPPPPGASLSSIDCTMLNAASSQCCCLLPGVPFGAGVCV